MGEPQYELISMEEIFPIMQEVLQSGGEFQLIPSGISMTPLLRHRRDTAVLVSPPEHLQKYDVPLYRRDDGHFVLHRVIGENENGYILCGDHQFEPEYGIRHDQVLAIMRAYIRDGQRTECTDKGYLRYAKRRCASRPWRKLKWRVCRVGKRILKKDRG